MAHKWADWLHNPCNRGGGGSPLLQSGGKYQEWPTIGRIGYITAAISGPASFKAREKIRNGPQLGGLAT